MSHFRKIVSYLLLCPPCARGKQKSDGIIDPDVLEHFHETWFSVHDDIRWFFLRDAAYVAPLPSSHFFDTIFFTIELCLTRRHQTHIYIYLQTYFRFWCGCRHSPRSSLSSTRGGFQSWESNLRNLNTSKRSPRLVELPSANPMTMTTTK